MRNQTSDCRGIRERDETSIDERDHRHHQVGLAAKGKRRRASSGSTMSAAAGTANHRGLGPLGAPYLIAVSSAISIAMITINTSKPYAQMLLLASRAERTPADPKIASYRGRRSKSSAGRSANPASRRRHRAVFYLAS